MNIGKCFFGTPWRGRITVIAVCAILGFVLGWVIGRWVR